MTWFLSVRSQDVAGPVVPAFVVASQGGPSPTYRPIEAAQARGAFAGMHLVLAVHGFNVSRPSAVRAMVLMEQTLALPGDTLFLGVLWPGDYWIPAVNYPTEA